MGEIGGLAVFAAWCAWLSVSDLRTRRLPNAVTLPGAAVILAAAAVGDHLRPALVGGCLLAGGYLLVHLARPAAMGGGDVKLALGLGAVTAMAGPQAWLAAAVGAFVVTACVGGALRLAGRPVAHLPHGPSMCLVSLLALAL
ncbi:prepilin peptidase [Rhodococcus sp. NPDC003318]|uniref:prepilin peptidase n=1 Tax=Rhodococcus sp. NPDC003318 TaxID=3364503 RepID=UPI00367CCABF